MKYNTVKQIGAIKTMLEMLDRHNYKNYIIDYTDGDINNVLITEAIGSTILNVYNGKFFVMNKLNEFETEEISQELLEFMLKRYYKVVEGVDSRLEDEKEEEEEKEVGVKFKVVKYDQMISDLDKLISTTISMRKLFIGENMPYVDYQFNAIQSIVKDIDSNLNC